MDYAKDGASHFDMDGTTEIFQPEQKDFYLLELIAGKYIIANCGASFNDIYTQVAGCCSKLYKMVVKKIRLSFMMLVSIASYI